MRVTRGLLLAVGVPAFFVLTAMSTLADSSPSPTAGGAATGAQALPGDPSKGETLYATSGCAQCHGSGLEGGVGPALNPIVQLPGVSDALSPAFLIDTITKGRPGTAMQPKGGNDKLTDQDIKDLAAFIIQKNREGEPPLSPGELAKRTILWVSIGIIAMVFVTYLLSSYNMRWIARRAAARRK
ncbi:MAG TPA: cytochrome c [Candidatus Dormibacteraeota bacterium]|jgi:mono/diheme cytochrome c family protein|nr:cytochrome c [Candidatus Dormibacteraeota bacterium]